MKWTIYLGLLTLWAVSTYVMWQKDIDDWLMPFTFWGLVIIFVRVLAGRPNAGRRFLVGGLRNGRRACPLTIRQSAP
jgi:hypothetical protein